MKIYLASWFFLLSVLPVFCQLNISGVILDRNTRLPVAYAGIGIPGTEVGTLTNQQGAFELTLHDSQLKDSIRIGAIGYKPAAFQVAGVISNKTWLVYIDPLQIALDEVVIRAKKSRYKILGHTRYHKNYCTGFASTNGKGAESAILIKNKRKIKMEAFSFYVVQNTYNDSIPFRLTFYNQPEKPADKLHETGNWVGQTFLKRPVVFKLGIKQGEFTLPLGNYNIQTTADFFVSLECLSDEMDVGRFCYTSSDKDPGYYKVRIFSSWRRTKSGGPDFNVKVICLD